MSGGGGSPETNNEPWSSQKPYLEQGFRGAERDVKNRLLEYFPGSTVIPFSPETEMALGATANRALSGSPLLGAAQDYTGDVLSGEYLDPETNPFFEGMMDSVVSAVRPGIDSRFAMAGRSGTSPLAAEALGRGVSRGAMPWLASEYGRERGIMEGAAARAPGLAREDYYDIDRLGQVGGVREGQAGRELQDVMNRYNFAQGEPTNRLAQYMGLIQGNYGRTSSTSGGGANPLLLGTGAALGLAGLPTAGGGSVGGGLLGK